MFGFVLAGLYVVASILFEGVAPLNAVAVAVTFLWYWHVTVYCCLTVLITCVGTAMMIIRTTNKKSDWFQLALMGLITNVFTALYLSSLWLISGALVAEGDYAIVQNPGHLTAGCILYTIVMLFQAAAMRSKK